MAKQNTVFGTLLVGNRCRALCGSRKYPYPPYGWSICCSRKYPYSPPKGFFWFEPSTPLEFHVEAHTFIKKFWPLRPLPLGISNDPLWWGYGYFLELHNGNTEGVRGMSIEGPGGKRA